MKGLIIILKNNEIRLAHLCQSNLTYNDMGIILTDQLSSIIKDKIYGSFKLMVDTLTFNNIHPALPQSSDNIINLILSGATSFNNDIDYIESVYLDYSYIINLDDNKITLISKHKTDYRIPLYRIGNMIATDLKFIRSFNINSAIDKNFKKFIQLQLEGIL